jgi:fructokinase
MILCCGEALIDMIPKPTTSGPDGFVPHSGGAVFNTSIALGRLGEPTGLLSGVSRDMFGQQLLAGLVESHVDATHIITSDRPTTLAFVKLADGHATYSFFDENSAGRMLEPGDMPALPDTVDTLFFGGISLACEPGADAYAAFLNDNAKARVVMMDPNIRPTFIQGEARFRSRLDGMIAQTDIIKVSDEDLDWLLPDGASHDAKVQALHDKGPSVIILTRGGDGATGYIRGGEQVTAAAQKVKVVDTVGAGDTFNAGFLAKLSQLGLLKKEGLKTLSPEALKEALAYGAQVAAITVSRAGANPPWTHEL